MTPHQFKTEKTQHYLSQYVALLNNPAASQAEKDAVIRMVTVCLNDFWTAEHQAEYLLFQDAPNGAVSPLHTPE